MFVFHCFFQHMLPFPQVQVIILWHLKYVSFLDVVLACVLWPLPIYWMWIVHHINANLQSIREALCCVVLCPKLSNFDSSATCPLLLQFFLQYLHIHQLIESAQSTKYIVFVWVSSLKIPPRTPADPLSNHITHPFHPSSHNFWNIGNSKRRKIWQLQGRMPWGLWVWSFGV